MISRTLSSRIKGKLNRGKAIIIMGPRQVGKTTLIMDYLKNEDFQFFSGDDALTRSIFNVPNTEKIRELIGNKKIVFFDEAQRVNEIGLTLKIIVDQFKDVQLWVSGSSSFDLFNELNEPLTGRKWEYQLYPVSWEEYQNHVGYLVSEQQLEQRLIYGMYPDVLNNPGEEREILRTLVNSYLYKDVLAFSGIRKPEVLEKLVRALALQVGNEVNYNELSKLIEVDKNTIQRYIDILEKAYVIFRLRSFSKNDRNEIKKSRKIYFYDNGIRNAVIGKFDDIATRTDIGGLWENFLVSERLKQNDYKLTFAKPFFWRTKQQQEIDYVELKEGTKLTGFEFKWNSAKNVTFPATFVERYQAKTSVVNRNNFREFVIIN
jgi:predicted AAA+ superfamily ATPase